MWLPMFGYFLIIQLSLLLMADNIQAIIEQQDQRAECHGNQLWPHCRSPLEMAFMVRELRHEVTRFNKQLVNDNCTICWSDPCQNGGECVPINEQEYRCDCPPDYKGKNCEILIECAADTCGENAYCFVAHHQLNCVCKHGYEGDPIKGCTIRLVSAGMGGDPHIKTFDDQRYDYMGTCPYEFVVACVDQFPEPFQDFAVRAKNELSFTNAHVSSVREFEVDFYGVTFHVDSSFLLYVNKIETAMPYSFPNASNPLVKFTYANSHVTIRDVRGIVIYFSFEMLYVNLPDLPLFQGDNVVCGLAGNRDSNCSNDFKTRDGKMFEPKNSSCYNRNDPMTEIFGDTYITHQFLDTKLENPECITGVMVTANYHGCEDFSEAEKHCEPIRLAAKGEGPFANCIGLGENVIQNSFDECINDVCQRTSLVCNSLSIFAKLCQYKLPNVMLDWRREVDCPDLHCPLHSKYVPCASGCPLTCQHPDRDEICTENCMEGCECEPGYVLDESVPMNPECKLLEDCGCIDSSGNYKQAEHTWLTDDCRVLNFCEDGKFVQVENNCSTDAICAIDIHFHYRCQCKTGYQGDGYFCEDIDECEDPRTCNTDKGQGTCTNTPGSFFCTCDEYYRGEECQDYRPLRHCADLYKYHEIRENGPQILKLRKQVNGSANYVSLDVYCDMETEEEGHMGGWTVVSNAKDDLMSGKTYLEYVDGFGDPSKNEVWIGLENLHHITSDVPMNMRLHLHYCSTPRRDKAFTYCTYPNFKVLNSSTQYTLILPFECYGNDSTYVDGWKRWSGCVGPKFTAFDIDTTNCSSYFMNTGFWYDFAQRCGSANFNGVGYQCDDPPPVETLGSHTTWNNNPVSAVQMLMRPNGYPNYEQAPATTDDPTDPTTQESDGPVDTDHSDHPQPEQSSMDDHGDIEDRNTENPVDEVIEEQIESSGELPTPEVLPSLPVEGQNGPSTVPI